MNRFRRKSFGKDKGKAPVEQEHEHEHERQRDYSGDAPLLPTLATDDEFRTSLILVRALASPPTQTHCN